MLEISTCDINRLEEMTASALHPVITTHMKPDGDAMGSSIAMYHFLRMSGSRECRILLNDRYPSYLDFITDEGIRNDIVVWEEDPVKAEEAIRDCDLLICLDFNSFQRTDKMQKALEASQAPSILIDHHINPDTESFSLVFSVQEISSASELLYHILMSTSSIMHDAGRLPSQAVAALMTGMTTDTNNFANSVYPSTLKMASELLGAGADRDAILYNLFNRFSEQRLRLLGHILKDLMTITEDGTAYIVIDKDTIREYGIKEGDTEGFVNMPLSIEKVRMSLLLKEEDGKARVSIRSKKGTSANRFAVLYFNGGGHENAAGGKLIIPDDIDSIDAAAAYIENKARIFMNEQNG